MQYILRNPAKVREHLGHELFMRVVNSLKHHFATTKNIEFEESDGGEGGYRMLVIDDIGHTVSVIIFYVVAQQGDWVRLAFKEFAG